MEQTTNQTETMQAKRFQHGELHQDLMDSLSLHQSALILQVEDRHDGPNGP